MAFNPGSVTRPPKSEEELIAEAATRLPLYLSEEELRRPTIARRREVRKRVYVIAMIGLALLFVLWSPERPAGAGNLMPLTFAIAAACAIGGARLGWLAAGLATVYVMWILRGGGGTRGLGVAGAYWPWLFQLAVTWTWIPFAFFCNGSGGGGLRDPVKSSIIDRLHDLSGGIRERMRWRNVSNICKVRSSSDSGTPAVIRLSKA
jgi:hypothetical protein